MYSKIMKSENILKRSDVIETTFMGSPTCISKLKAINLYCSEFMRMEAGRSPV